MAQAEAPIARNSAQLRASEFRLDTLEYMYIFYYPEIDIMESVFSKIFLFFILKK